MSGSEAAGVTTYLTACAPASREALGRELAFRQASDVRFLGERRVLYRSQEALRPWFALHQFPVQLQVEVPSFEFDALRDGVAWSQLPLQGLQGDYAIQVTSEERWPQPFSVLTAALAERWAPASACWAPRRPEHVWSLHTRREGGRFWVYSGISPVSRNLSLWAGGECRIPRSPDQVSRAELKLLEAWEAFALESRIAPGRALDMGAAPGGWSRVLLSRGFQVDAVDPAPLDPRLQQAEGLRSYRETIGQFLQRNPQPYRLVTCDMKMSARMAAELLVSCASLVDPAGGYLVATFKLGRDGPVWKEARDAIARLEAGYRIDEVRQLYFHRSELSVLARRLVPRGPDSAV